MKNNFNLKNIFGIIFVFLGLCFNRTVLEKIFSIYSVIELNYRLPLFPTSIALIAFGLLLILIKKENLTFEKIITNYKFLAITLFSAFLLFVFANVLVYSLMMLKDIEIYKSQIFVADSQPLEPLYPSLSKSELNQFLRETWSRPYVYEPYTQFKERTFTGKYINVSEHGYRVVKDQGAWPPSKENINIFLFGGSTAFNYGVPENETIASRLQELLSTSSKKVCVYNFGRGNYFSSQERILFQKLLSNSFIPDLAIFLDGLNDFYYVNDEPLFTENFRNYLDGKGTFVSGLPVFTFLNSLSHDKPLRHHRKEVQEIKYNDKNVLNDVIQRYAKNKKQIEAIAKEFNVKPIFIWQPVPTYKYDLKYHIFSGRGFGQFMYSKYGYEEMEKYVKAHDMGNNFFWLADMQENLKKPLYIDIDHYSPEMSKEIAMKIHEFLIPKNLMLN